VAVKLLLDTNAYSALACGEAELAERVRGAERIVRIGSGSP
jgi:hypothetical protein